MTIFIWIIKIMHIIYIHTYVHVYRKGKNARHMFIGILHNLLAH